MKYAAPQPALLPLMAYAETPAPLVPSFTESTATAGVSQIYAGDWEYMVGGGVSSFDCNADARPDLIIAGGTNPAKLLVNQARPAVICTSLKPKAGWNKPPSLGPMPLILIAMASTSCFCAKAGFRRCAACNCKFENANKAWGFDGGTAWSAAFAAIERGQNWPTLAIGNYIDATQDMFPWGSCTDNWLHRPDGQKFAAPIPLKPSFCALSMLFSDWNRSGTPSLRIANDREYYKGGQEQLWHIDPGKPPRFTPRQKAGNACASGAWGLPVTISISDGYPEYFVTSMADNKLQTMANTETKAATFKDNGLRQTRRRSTPSWRTSSGLPELHRLGTRSLKT